MFNKITEMEEIPTQWQKGIDIVYTQKGNRDDLNYYNLLSNLHKIFTKILTNRLAKIMDESKGQWTTYTQLSHRKSTRISSKHTQHIQESI